MIWLLTSVTATASNIPEDDIKFPLCAVSGDPNCFSPNINSIEAIMYAKFAKISD